MEVIYARNVCGALQRGIERLDHVGQRATSRAGDVVVAPSPVMTVYNQPTERVLFEPLRDANPFFHLLESIWMLGGRRDAQYLSQFVRDFGDRFAESDGTLWGAYGHRWRESWGSDQLTAVVERLRRDPTDRRVVIAMWDPTYDLIEPDHSEEGDLIWPEAEPRDLPCNTHVYLRVRQEHDVPLLDLTVCCRSNDIIWGAYGANAVHFSVLQEYLAARIGVHVGRMYQLSNNWHAYTEVVQRMFGERLPSAAVDPYSTGEVAPTPMFDSPDLIDQDVRRFLDEPFDSVYANDWFHDTAVPMLWAHRNWREGHADSAMDMISRVSAADWRLAAQQWLERRAS